MSDERSSLAAGYQRANARMDEAEVALGAQRRVDLTGMPPGAAALLLERVTRGGGAPTLVVTADSESARRASADLRFFLGEGPQTVASQVLLYPASDTSPYLDVAPDRRATMDRLAVLFHLAQGLPCRFVVASAAALVRRVAPRAAIVARSTVVESEGELERDDFVDLLVAAGYLRVPVAEDPGTFAVRGGILDVFPPHARHPARIELDDWLVLSIKHFDPDDQKTLQAVDRLFVHPVRDTLLGAEERDRAQVGVREICDAIDLPSTRTRQLLDDLSSGREFYGLQGLMPAFYERLETLLDYLGPDAAVAVFDPTAVNRAVTEEREGAALDLAAKRHNVAPAYPLDEHYIDEGELMGALAERRLTVVHKLAVLGAASEDESPLAALETVDADTLMHLGGEDQLGLVGELELQRKAGNTDDALLPVALAAIGWLDTGMHLLFTARSHAQADRLVSLLRGYEVPVGDKPTVFDPAMLAGRPSGRAEVVVGELGGGFVLATEGLVVVTEEEIFGTRAHKRQRRKKRKSDAARAFVEDLSQLAVGDYVIHTDHGVGCYLGLQRHSLGQSQAERMLGRETASVEVLIVEYRSGDKLFLPVTRLNQLQKYAGGEGKKPKIDKLGGQSFTKTKGKVKKAVRKLADELLRLYAERAATERDPLPLADRAYTEFEATFPFEETPDQAKAIDEVLGDLEADKPMDRLVCGDVGFGKTEVALRAAFRVAMTGRQVAVLCPTTVLAQQHYNTFRERLAPYPLEVGVLSRFVDKASQTKTLTRLKEGKLDVVIGTHRLLSKDVHFGHLGLLVVDEEQRFGVTHKERIKKLKAEVDVLTLSATPIPRTLQLAIGGLRNLSIISTAPVDRRAVRTFACRWDDHLIREAIQRELNRGGQVFFVYNRIEGLYERAHRLQGLLPDTRIVVAHGQMKEGQLERAMTDFVDGQYDVLCSTAIIESGLDIPRANTMIVDRADMFGLSQLYQIRGRVGRSRERAYCYLVTPPPSAMTDEARSRIEALERFTQLGSGFQVASLDMELRGAGDLLGAEQSGSVSLVGFDMFVQMLEQAVAELRGEPVVHDVDPELTLDVEHFLPEDYIDDVGLRLSFYKRFAGAPDEQAIEDLAAEMEDRFGPPPDAARQLVRVMNLRPSLRDYRVLGCEASQRRVTLHLREDTPLDPSRIMGLVAQPSSRWKLTPDMKLTRSFDPEREGDAVDRVAELLRALSQLRK